MKNLLTILFLFTLLSCEKEPENYIIPDPVYQTCTVVVEQVIVKTPYDSIYNELYVIRVIEDINTYRNETVFYLEGSNRIDFPIKAESITLKLYPFGCDDVITHYKIKVYIDRKLVHRIEGKGDYLTIL